MVGEFKDDCLQRHDHDKYLGGAIQNLVNTVYQGVTGWGVVSMGGTTQGGDVAYRQFANGRFGNITRMKSKGVKFIIKVL